MSREIGRDILQSHGFVSLGGPYWFDGLRTVRNTEDEYIEVVKDGSQDHRGSTTLWKEGRPLRMWDKITYNSPVSPSSPRQGAEGPTRRVD